MITPVTFLDELEAAFPELREPIAAERASFDSARSVADVYRWVDLLRQQFERALADAESDADGGEAMLVRCFDFLERLFREAHAHVLTPVNERMFDLLRAPGPAAACATYGGAYTQMALKFDAEGLAPD